ncbi:hypothetical protein [Blastococcus sp. SYSU D00813]
MSRSSAVVRPVPLAPRSPYPASLYSAICLALAVAGLATGRVLEAVLLVAGVVAHLLLASPVRSRSGAVPALERLRSGEG